MTTRGRFCFNAENLRSIYKRPLRPSVSWSGISAVTALRFVWMLMDGYAETCKDRFHSNAFP